MSQLDTNDFTESNFVQNQRLNDIAEVVNGLVVSEATQQRKVILFGDSFAATQGGSVGVNTTSLSLYRFILGAIGNGISVVRNSGVSGNTYAQMLARINDDVINVEAEYVFMNGGVNDIFGESQPANVAFGNAKSCIDAILSSGKKLFLFNCVPQLATRSGFTSSKSEQCAIFNQLLISYVSGLSGCVLIDLYSEFINWTDTVNGEAKAGLLAGDGIHLSTYGEIVASQIALPKLLNFFNEDKSLTNSPVNLGIAGSEGLFLGTSGTNGTGSSGTVATQYTSSRALGAGSIVASKIGLRGQRQTVSLVANNGDVRTRLQGNLQAELSAHTGKTVITKVLFRVRTVSGAVSLRDLVIKLTIIGSLGLTQTVNGTTNAQFPTLTDNSFDTGLQLITLSPILVDSSLTSATGMYFETLLDSVGGGVVEFDIYGFEIKELV